MQNAPKGAFSFEHFAILLTFIKLQFVTRALFCLFLDDRFYCIYMPYHQAYSFASSALKGKLMKIKNSDIELQ